MHILIAKVAVLVKNGLYPMIDHRARSQKEK